MFVGTAFGPNIYVLYVHVLVISTSCMHVILMRVCIIVFSINNFVMLTYVLLSHLGKSAF